MMPLITIPLTSAALALVTLVAAPALAARPAADDPVRQAFVVAVRQHPAFASLQGKRLEIRRIRVFERLGFLCAMPVGPDGRHVRQDDAYVVHQVVLRREGARWQPVAQLEGLSQSHTTVQCASDERGQVTEAFLEALAKRPQHQLAGVAPAHGPAPIQAANPASAAAR